MFEIGDSLVFHIPARLLSLVRRPLRSPSVRRISSGSPRRAPKALARGESPSSDRSKNSGSTVTSSTSFNRDPELQLLRQPAQCLAVDEVDRRGAVARGFAAGIGGGVNVVAITVSPRPNIASRKPQVSGESTAVSDDLSTEATQSEGFSMRHANSLNLGRHAPLWLRRFATPTSFGISDSSGR
jgi:hypothetical protein